MLLRINFSFLFIVFFTIFSCNTNKSKDNSATAIPNVSKNTTTSNTPTNYSNYYQKEFDRILKKAETDTLTQAEKEFLGEVLKVKIKNSARFRKKYVESEFKKWKRLESKKGSPWLENIIRSTFGDDTWNEYQNQKDSKENKTNPAKK